jgi:hypothetical protein
MPEDIHWGPGRDCFRVVQFYYAITKSGLTIADRSQSPFVGKSAVPCGFWETLLLQGRCVCIDRFHSEMIERDHGKNEMRRLLAAPTTG